MKRYLLTIAVLVVFFTPGKSGEILYKVSDIPSGLKENARSVIRKETREFTVADINKATLKVFIVTTVLNKNGIEDANLMEFYDKYRSISSLKGRVFDENGVLIKKIANDDIKDYSAISGYSVYEDDRVKFIDPGIRQVPFTVEYYYEINFTGILSYPTWYPASDFNVAVEQSSFKTIIAKNLELRYRECNLPAKGIITTDEKNNIYSWQVENQKAFKWEPLCPPRRDYFPVVMLAPAVFEIGGYKGSAVTWADFGDWIFSLIQGKDILNPETVTELNDMVKGCKDDKDKICKIYQYMQGRVRYVNLTIGIGGWQPIDAATVHRLAYGDCKALTNYMKAMLKAVGINSFYCPVYAGESAPDVITSFPSNQFNHIILCVPVDNDTLWLECTSQKSPCGYLGGFTENRHALLIDKSNSHLVMTQESRPEENIEKCTARLTFDATGSGNLSLTKSYHGQSYDDILPAFLADDIDKKKMISNRMTFPSFQVGDYHYEEFRSSNPYITETISVSFENYLTLLNSRFLMPLNCIDRITSSPPNSRNRKVDIVIRNGATEIDSLIFQIPSQLRVESLPEPVDIVSPFGHYSSYTRLQENDLLYIRTFQFNKGTHPADLYPDLIDFFDKIAVADDEKCIFVRNE